MEILIARDGTKKVFKTTLFFKVREALHIKEDIVGRSRWQHAYLRIIHHDERVLSGFFEAGLQLGLLAKFVKTARYKITWPSIVTCRGKCSHRGDASLFQLFNLGFVDSGNLHQVINLFAIVLTQIGVFTNRTSALHLTVQREVFHFKIA